jgi:hypothetical protein
MPELTGVNANLLNILNEAADDFPYKVRVQSGLRKGDPRQHGRGNAVDVQILDENDEPIPNYQNGDTFKVYEEFAQKARQKQLEKYPDMKDAFRWGGYFGGKKNYGAMDLMHFDAGGGNGLGMAGGTWDTGLNQQQRAYYPTAQSSGGAALKAIDTAMAAKKKPAEDNFDDLIQQYTTPSTPAPAPGEKGFVLTIGGPKGKPAAADDDFSDLIQQYTAAPTVGAEVAPAPTAEEVYKNRDASGVANDAGRAIASGVPIVGAVLNRANAATNALLAPVGNQFFAPEDQLKGDTFGERYANSLAQQEGMDKNFAAANPKTNLALNLLGGTIAAGGVGSTATGAKLLGVTGGTLAKRAAASALSGGVINAADTAIKTNGDVESTLKAGGLGVAAGGLLPVAAAGIGSVARGVMNALQPVESRVANRLVNARDLIGPTGVADADARMLANQRLTAMDVNPNATALAQGLAVQPTGEARNILGGAISQRAQSAPQAVQGVFDSTLGHAPDVPALLDTMKQTARQNAAQGFGNAMKGAAPVDIRGLPTEPLDAAFQRATAKLPDNGASMTQIERMHAIQSQLGREARELSKSSVGSERLASHDIESLRQKLIGKIDQATGEKFRPAQAKYADDMAVQDAFEKGTTILNGGKSLENRPDAWAKWYSATSKEEKDSVKLGARTAIDNYLGQARGAAARGEAVTGSEFNLEKLKTIFGDKEATRLRNIIRDESDIARTNSLVTGNSQTASRQQMAGSVAPREISPVGASDLTSIPGLGALGYVAGGLSGALPTMAVAGAARLVKRGAEAIGRRNDIRANDLLARTLSTPGQQGVAMQNALLQSQAARNSITGVAPTIPLRGVALPPQLVDDGRQRMNRLLGQR